MSTATATPTAFATHDEVHEVMWTFKPAIMATMKKLLLALLAVAALAVVAVVIFENTPERRMDRRERRMDRWFDKLVRTYDDPKQLYQRLADDRDRLGLVLVRSFMVSNGPGCSCDPRTTMRQRALGFDHRGNCDYRAYQKQHLKLYAHSRTQIDAELCDCGRAPSPSVGRRLVVFLAHPDDCKASRAWRDMKTTWGPYIRRKTKEFQEAELNR